MQATRRVGVGLQLLLAVVGIFALLSVNVEGKLRVVEDSHISSHQDIASPELRLNQNTNKVLRDSLMKGDVHERIARWRHKTEAATKIRKHQKEKLALQRIKAGGALPPSAKWMSLMKEILANMTPAGTYHLDFDISTDAPDWAIDLIDFLEKIGIDEPLAVIKEWATTQVFSIYEQLYYGMRFLDLRVTWDSATQRFRTLHMIMGDEFKILLNDIAKFMNESTEEILILQFGNFASFNDSLHATFIKDVEALLGQYLYPRNKPFITYANMIASGKRIVAFYDSNATISSNINFWFDANLADHWADVDNFPALLPIEVQSVQTQSGNPEGIYKLQWILTASAERIVAALFDPYAAIQNLHDLDRTCNINFDSFLDEMQTYRMNLLMVDFFEETDNLEQSRMANRQQCNDDPKYRALSPDHQDCRSWAIAGLCISNSTVQTYCPLSCDRCKQISGEPGAPCTANSQCIYNICNTQKGICLTDMPRDPKDPCGTNSQCWSAVCTNWMCV